MVPQTILYLGQLVNAGLAAASPPIDAINLSEIRHTPLSREDAGAIEHTIKDGTCLVIVSVRLDNVDNGSPKTITATLDGKQLQPERDPTINFGDAVLYVFRAGALALTFAFSGLPNSTAIVYCDAFTLPGRAIEVLSRCETKAKVSE